MNDRPEPIYGAAATIAAPGGVQITCTGPHSQQVLNDACNAALAVLQSHKLPTGKEAKVALAVDRLRKVWSEQGEQNVYTLISQYLGSTISEIGLIKQTVGAAHAGRLDKLLEALS